MTSPAGGGPGRRDPGDGLGAAGTPTRTGTAPATRRAPRVRTGVSVFLVVASLVAVLVASVALWSHSIVFDTEAYVRVVAPVVEDSAVRKALSDHVAAGAVQAADLETRIEGALPADAKVLAPALTQSLQRFLVEEIYGFLGTELARRLWEDANRVAHERFITALRDENRSVTAGDVRLDLLPLVAVALQRLHEENPGLLGRDVTLPRIDPATPPDEMRILLQDALGRRLPPDLGAVTLLRGDQGARARQALELFDRLVILAVVLTVVLIAAALLVSVRRRRTALWLGLGSLLVVVAARVIEAQLEKAVAGAVQTQGGAAVARSILESAVRSLSGFFVWVAVAGAIVAAAAVLAARPAWLEAIGRGVAGLFGVSSDLTTPDTVAGRWMAAHIDLLRIAGVAVAVVALLFVTGSPTAVLVIVLALAVYELALSAYAAGTPRQPREDAAGEPPASP